MSPHFLLGGAMLADITLCVFLCALALWAIYFKTDLHLYHLA